jgi:RNA polymerase sigma-70 factor, ECF subfamily
MTQEFVLVNEGDAKLAERLLARDEAALREVIQLYGGLVNGMARRVLGNPTLAEEVAQDAFVSLWRRPGAFDPQRGSLKSFLSSIARNKAIDLVRKEESLKRTKDSVLQEMSGQEESVSFEGRVEERSEVMAALHQLSAPQREAIVLAYFGGRTYREVAAELNTPEGTVKTRMRDGLTKLRRVLSEGRLGTDNE